MKKQNTLTLLTLLSVSALTILAGCGSLEPNVKSASGVVLDNTQNRPTLLVHMSIKPSTSSSDDDRLLKQVNDAADSKHLETIGEDAYNQLATLLTKEGYALSTDREQARRFGNEKQNNRKVGSMSGYWYHPETTKASFSPGMIGLNFPTIALELRDQENLEEHFTSVDVTISEGHGFTVGPIGRYYPIVDIRIRIINNAGKEVYRA